MKIKSFLAGIALFSLIWGCSDQETETTPVQNSGVVNSSVLIVVHGTSAIFDGSDLVLQGVGPSLTWFTDRPEHRVGSMKSERLERFWSFGKDSFAENPPNAAAVVEGHPPVIVEFTSVSVTDDVLTFPTIVLQGDMPRSGGPTTLVIDGAPIPDCCFDPQNIECSKMEGECDGRP